MFYTCGNERDLHDAMEAIGLRRDIADKTDVLIKINLSRPYTRNLPRTDMAMLRTVIDYVYRHGGRCAIAEGANGFLEENLVQSGLRPVLQRYHVEVIDVDMEDAEEVVSLGETHHLPRCFREYPVRIAMPAASKREGMVYSNNIKLFVGAVPRSRYQLDAPNAGCGAPRPRMHIDLHASVASLYLAMQRFSPFPYHINGGLSYREGVGEFRIEDVLIGNDAWELDNHLFHAYFAGCAYPAYLDIVKDAMSRRER